MALKDSTKPGRQCRVCSRDLFTVSLLRYENMPKGAQYLPDARQLDMDCGATLQVGQCAGCGLVQLKNQPVPYFKEVIRATAVSDEMKRFRQSQFADFIISNRLEKKKIIEVGCGKGEFLNLLKDFDVDCYGVEYSAASVEYCRRSGLNVEKHFIEIPEENLRHGPFEAFLILNFLEHLPDPNTLLSGLHYNLCDGAVGLVEVPNFDMQISGKLFSEFIGDHLLYFTKETLKFTLQHNGFEVLDIHEIWYDYILCAVVRKRQPMDLSGFSRQQAHLTKTIQAFINRFGSRKVAIWGAGHQALAMIALTGIAPGIRYVVDSAPFKQGKFTPATHLPIVAPEQLRTDPVEAIIVMAASYSDEVAGILRRDFPGHMAMAILRDFGLEEGT